MNSIKNNLIFLFLLKNSKKLFFEFENIFLNLEKN